MLTDQAARERKWGRFPALRKALEDKRIPDNYYGSTSMSGDMFDALHRLVEIAVLTREHESVVKATAQAVGREHMHHDLHHLQDELKAASSFFIQQAEDIGVLLSKL